MKTPFIIIAFGLLLFGCGRRDAQLQKEVAGDWTRGSYFQMSFSPDGSFISRWATTNVNLIYQGTWKIEEGSLVSTITNCLAEGTTNYEKVGSVESWAIIRADSSELDCSNNSQVVSYTRK